MIRPPLTTQPSLAESSAFTDPLAGKTLLELRCGPGNHQTVFPPSVVDGERREWDGDVIAPRVIPAADLRLACAWLAIGCLVARHVSEYAARHPGRDLPALLAEAEPQLGRCACHWLGMPVPGEEAAAPVQRSAHRNGHSNDLGDIVARIPNTCGWHDWVKVGLAIYAASNGQDFKVFEEFSARSEKHHPERTADKWREFHKWPPDNIGIGSLIRWANKGAVR
jgi:hypothetical protein